MNIYIYTYMVTHKIQPEAGLDVISVIRARPNERGKIDDVLWKARFQSIFVLKSSGSTRETSLQVPTKL